MKVFKLNDCDWYMAETLEDAVKLVCNDTGLPPDEAADEPSEETPERMARLNFVDHDGSERTFAEELQRRVAAGKKPGMFASTEF